MRSTVAIVAICGAWLILSVACTSRPKNETVTTLPPSAKSPTTNAPPVPNTTTQPSSSSTVDRDLEAAGDDVARARVRLGQRNRRGAIEALDDARTIVRTRVMADLPLGSQSDRLRPQVEEVAREIAEVRSEIEHGDISRARQELISINTQLDNLRARS